jgi:nucleoside-diphosphate-sugar epimerase
MAPPAPDGLIVGCGYLGRRVAAKWREAGRRVAALTRRNTAVLSALGIDPVVGDVLDPASLRDLPPADTVLFAVGLDRAANKTQHEIYVHGLGHVLDTLPPPRRFVYVSSTGVYGQTDGGWVDEASPTEPVEPSGRVILEAERLLRARMPDAIVLRFAGIYGPGRLLRQQALLAGEPLVGDSRKWLNLIHVEDGADAVVAAAERGAPGETYNVTDDEPVPRRDFYTLLAELLRAPVARFDDRPEPGTANRRVSNRKALQPLGWAPRYRSYREGLHVSVRLPAG